MKNVPLIILILIGSFTLAGNASHAAIQPEKKFSWSDEPTLVILPNMPNPFSEETRIRFALGSPQHVTVRMYNILGIKVATLLEQDLDSGEHTLLYKKPSDLPDGVYIYSIETPSVTKSKRMIIRREYTHL